MTRALDLVALDARVRVDAPAELQVLFTDVFHDLVDQEGNSRGVASRAVDLAIRWLEVGDGRWHVSLGGGGSMVGSVASGLAEMIVAINRAAAASVAAESTVLHAGAFEVDGAAIAVTGRSGAGKSTLVAAAVLAGHGYLADEVTVVDPVSYVVRPYFRPIGLRAGGAAAIGVDVPDRPDEAFAAVYPWRVGRAGRLAGSAPLRLVAFIDRRPGPVEVRPVSPDDALVRLTDLSLASGGTERPTFRRFERLVRNVPAVKAQFGDSADASSELARRLVSNKGRPVTDSLG